MNRVFALFLAVSVAACRTTASMPSLAARSTEHGTPRAAAEQMLVGLKLMDFELVGSVWGSRDYLVRDQYPRREFEMRTLIIGCRLGGQSFEITGQRPDTGSGVNVFARLKRDSLTHRITLRAVPNAKAGWVVESIDFGSVPQNCDA